MNPAGELPAPLVRIDFRRQILAQPHYNFPEIDATPAPRRLLTPDQKVGMRDIRFALPGNFLGDCKPSSAAQNAVGDALIARAG